MAQLARVRYRD